jgi:hypothetical protein
LDKNGSKFPDRFDWYNTKTYRKIVSKKETFYQNQINEIYDLHQPILEKDRKIVNQIYNINKEINNEKLSISKLQIKVSEKTASDKKYYKTIKSNYYETMWKIDDLKSLLKKQKDNFNEARSIMKVSTTIPIDAFYNPNNFKCMSYPFSDQLPLLHDDILINIFSCMSNYIEVRKCILVSKSFASFIFQLNDEINGIILLCNTELIPVYSYFL